MKTVRIIGLNLNRLLSIIEENGIKLLQVLKISYDEIQFTLNSKDYKKLVALKILSCYNISVVNTTPRLPILWLLLKRMGLFVGLGVALFFMFNHISKIWNINIEIEGKANNIEQELVLKELEGLGVKSGKPLSLSTKELERELLLRVNNSSNIVVKKQGINLTIYIKVKVDEPQVSKADIVSEYDGKITDIKLKSGILVTNIGQGVSKGEVLIASGTVGDFYVEAMGEVYAKVLISGEAVGGLTTFKTERTGNVEKVCAYQILGKTYFLGKTIQEVGFKSFEVEQEETFISKNNCLPIKKVTYTIHELKEVEQKTDKETKIEELKEKALEIAKNNLPIGAELGEISYDIFYENEILKVECLIETEIEIGVRK